MYLPKYDSLSIFCYENSLMIEDEYENISFWTYGQIKDIPNELMTRFRRGSNIYETNLVDDLLSSEDFVPFEPKKLYGILKNPNFYCSYCGNHSPLDYFKHPLKDEIIYLWIEEDEDYKRACKSCFDEKTTLTENGFELKPQPKEVI